MRCAPYQRGLWPLVSQTKGPLGSAAAPRVVAIPAFSAVSGVNRIAWSGSRATLVRVALGGRWIHEGRVRI